LASNINNLSHYNSKVIPSASAYNFGIVLSAYHNEITNALKNACIETLLKHDAQESNIHLLEVPGAYELVYGAKLIAETQKLSAVITLGCVIKGETEHDRYINQAVAQSLMNLNLVLKIPFIFGLLTPNTLQQAKDRAGGKHGNKGTEAAITAIQMANLNNKLTKRKAIGF